MFWGLIMEPNKLYTQVVEKSFHVSMASLDVVAADNEIVQVKLCYDELTHLLCSLSKATNWQVPLDLNFQEGTKISFASNGRGRVYLSGYFIPEDDLDLDELEEEDDEDNEEVPQLVGNQPKRKAQDSLKDVKNIKRLKAALNQEESSDDDEDDLDNDDDDEEEEESLDINDANEDSDEDDDEDEEDSEEEEEEEKVEVKQKKKKNKQTEQQQQQTKKQDKQKLVNGKDAKQEQTKQKKGKEQQQNAQVQKKRVVAGGVQVEDIKIGNGAVATPGKFISVYYVGRLKNGKKFDATQQGDGFKFRLGKGEVIKGWDVGLSGMKIGGKRRITIPPAMAYGAKGSPPTIPGNSTLLFEVELKNVH